MKKKSKTKAEEKKAETTDAYEAIKDPIMREKFKFIEKYRISSKTEITPEQPCLSIGGVGFFNKGDIHAVKGMAKAGKKEERISIAYEEVMTTCYEMDGGMSEAEAYRILRSMME